MAMNAIKEETVDKLLEDLKDVPDKMRNFSLNMRALYSDKTVVSTSKYAEQFNGFKNELKRQAMFYMNVLNPLGISTVQSLKDLFEYYELLELDEWISNVEDIIDTVDRYRTLCQIIVKEHKKILVPLKKVEDEVHTLLPQVESSNKEMEDAKGKLMNSVASNYAFAVGAGSVEPSLLLFTLPIATVMALIKKSRVADLDNQSKVNDFLIATASETMIPTIALFISNVEALAGFFEVLYQELNSLSKYGDRRMKEIHFKMMRSKASQIQKHCKCFFAVTPQFETDLLAIRESVEDKSTDVWLEEKQKALQEDLSVNNLRELTERLCLQ